jgi:sRNA-binding protein
VDLDGNVVGKVTEAEQREAEQKIREIQTIVARKKQQMNDEDDYGEVERVRRRVPIPASVLPPDEQALFARIENLTLKARSLRMENEDIGAELAAKALELVRSDVDKLIGKYAGGKTH